MGVRKSAERKKLFERESIMSSQLFSPQQCQSTKAKAPSHIQLGLKQNGLSDRNKELKLSKPIKTATSLIQNQDQYNKTQIHGIQKILGTVKNKHGASFSVQNAMNLYPSIVYPYLQPTIEEHVAETSQVSSKIKSVKKALPWSKNS